MGMNLCSSRARCRWNPAGCVPGHVFRPFSVCDVPLLGGAGLVEQCALAQRDAELLHLPRNSLAEGEGPSLH